MGCCVMEGWDCVLGVAVGRRVWKGIMLSFSGAISRVDGLILLFGQFRCGSHGWSTGAFDSYSYRKRVSRLPYQQRKSRVQVSILQ